MSKLAQALADVQEEFDEKTRLIEELTEKLHMQVAENRELKRQLDKAYEQLTEQTQKATAAASGPVGASDEYLGPSLRRGKLSTDAMSDTLAFLNRFNIDATQMTSRQWRYVVEKMLTTQCLRELSYVMLRRQRKTCAHHDFPLIEPSGWGCRKDEPCSEPREDDDWVFVVSFGRSGEVAAPPDGAVQEDMRRGLAFQSFEAASDHLLRLIPSATISDLTMESLMPSEAFFKELLSVAPAISVKNFVLSGCDLVTVDADIFQQTLLQFHSVRKLVVKSPLLPGQISDSFLAAAAGKLALTQLRYVTKRPAEASAVTSDVTDYGIMQFLFQRTDKPVELQMSHANVSTTFCVELFQKALSEPAANDLCLNVRDVSLEQDLTGILDWRLPEVHENVWGTSKEIYGADALLGKRLRLTIHKSHGGAISSLEFQRSSPQPEQQRQWAPGQWAPFHTGRGGRGHIRY
ncbi:hypothetical protein AAVH_20299 [Aphelenchoides avenae]|nr:hypothetical protein AAVH_20299 [Aphelenchus avenae]